MNKNLIIYYSRKGENYVNGKIENLVTGNTEICAKFIQDAVGGDLFEIETVAEYAKDYHKCTEEAQAEIKNNARPGLRRYLDDISDYHNIFICGPCWWGTYPMAVFSLIEKLDFSGKRIFPLMTHEGSGLGSSIRDLKKICPGAFIKTGLAVHGADAIKSQQVVADWAAEGLDEVVDQSNPDDKTRSLL